MVMLGQSVHVTTVFLGKLDQAVSQYFVHILSLLADNNPSKFSGSEKKSHDQSPPKYGSCNTRGYYCYLAIKTRCVGFRLHTSTCVFPFINILPVNIKLLIKLFQVVR